MADGRSWLRFLAGNEVGGRPWKEGPVCVPADLGPRPLCTARRFPSSREAVSAGRTGNLIFLLDFSGSKTATILGVPHVGVGGLGTEQYLYLYIYFPDWNVRLSKDKDHPCSNLPGRSHTKACPLPTSLLALSRGAPSDPSIQCPEV